MWLIFGAFFFITAFAIIAYFDTKKPKGFPPEFSKTEQEEASFPLVSCIENNHYNFCFNHLGPFWIPLIGCHLKIYLLFKKLGFYHLVWEELSKKFGSVVGLRLGRDRIILISGQSAVKKALIKPEFDARPDGFFFRMRSYEKRLGIVFVEGNHFREQKKFCMMAMKKLGMGKKPMENIIIKEAEELIKCLSDQCKKDNIVRLQHVFDVAVLNSLWALMAGKRFAVNDQELSHLMSLVHEAFRLLDMSGGVLNQMPFLRYLAPNATGYNRIRYVFKNLESFLEKTVSEHKKNLGKEPKDIIDLFLFEVTTRSEEINSSFTDEQLIILLLDLFMAGSETTSNNLSMALLYMIVYPEVQKKVQNAIDEVVPGNRLPTLEDRLRLMYVEAVLLEIQRHATIVPIAVGHRATEEVIFNSYLIPKDATILINLRSVLMDKDRWGDPENFRPERFLDSKGQILQDDWFIPFGLGKRRCLGENLARSSMFLLFSAVMQNFQIVGIDSPSLTPQDGITLSPHPFKAILKQRFAKTSICHTES